MRKIFITLFISFLLFGCLRAKKSPFDLNSSSGIFGSIGISNIIGVSTSEKEITSFGFTSPSVSGSIADTNISLSVPFGTTITNLIADFTTTGQSVKVGSTIQTSGVTVNDFTNPVVYTVLASDNSTKDYTITVSVSGQTSAPSFNIATGTYYQDLAITISSSTVGADIYFNRGTNPTDPDCTGNSTLYSGPITIDSTGTIIKAIACKSGLAASPVVTETYTLKVAQTYPYSNNTENKIVIPYKFTATTSSVTTINKCLSTSGVPGCKADGTCATGGLIEIIYNVNSSVTVYAIGCKLNYTPSTVESKVFEVSAIRSTDNVYLTIVDPDSTTNILNKNVYICAEGETYNTTTGDCQGTASNFQFCSSNDDSCNGGSSTGIANNASPIFSYCNSKTGGIGLGGAWRVPTLNELTGFISVYAKSPNGWPVTTGTELWSNQSVLSGFANSVSNTGMYQTNINQTTKTTLRNLRCIHD